MGLLAVNSMSCVDKVGAVEVTDPVRSPSKTKLPLTRSKAIPSTSNWPVVSLNGLKHDRKSSNH